MTLAKSIGVSEERLLTLRAEAQRTFEHGAATGIPFYKTWKRAILVRFVAWYRGIVNRASGRYAELLAEAAKYHKGFGPGQHRDIEKEAQDFAREKIAQSVVRDWLGLFLGNRIEPGFSKMLTKVVTELADHESGLISEARANLARAAAIYGKKPRMRRRRASDVARSSRQKKIREIISLGCKGPQYCREIDRRKIPGKPEWLTKGWPGTYETAYKLGKKWQKRIQQEKWRIWRSGKD